MRYTETRLGLAAVVGAAFLLFGFGRGSCGDDHEHGEEAQVPCWQLNERGCAANPHCEAVYDADDCIYDCDQGPRGDGRCRYWECEPHRTFVECRERGGGECSGVVCEMWCEYGFARDASGCEICSCNPPPRPDADCRSDADCGRGMICEQQGSCACVTYPCDCEPEGVCVPARPTGCDPACGEDETCWNGACAQYCESDADCEPGTECVPFATCAAIGCPAPFSACLPSPY